MGVVMAAAVSQDWPAVTILLAVITLAVKGMLWAVDVHYRVRALETKGEEREKLWAQRMEAAERLISLQAGEINTLGKWQAAATPKDDRR